MTMKSDVANLQNQDRERIDDILKQIERVERFGEIKPDETVWTEERLLQNIGVVFPDDTD